MYVGDWLGKRALLTPNRIALVDDATGLRYTYQQLNQRAERLAYALRHRLNIRKGDRIAILAKNCVEYLDTLFATGKLGAVLLPLNWRLAVQELSYMLEHASPRILIYGAEFAATGRQLQAQPPVEQSIVLGYAEDGAPVPDAYAYASLTQRAAVGPVTETVTLDDPHIILYTSGTTGRPKGAVLPHRVMVWNAFNTNISWGLHSDDISVLHTPLFHTGGINVLTIPILYAGGTMVLMAEWDPERSLELIERERVSVFFAVPTMFQMLLQSPRFAEADLSSVRFFISGGAPCPETLIRAYQQHGVPFRQGYGLTEVSVNCFTLNPEDATRKPGSVGKPVLHLDARIVGPDGADVPQGAVGELWLRGPTVCAGYLNDPAASAEAIHDGWFRTGDMARVDAEGFYYIVDRYKDMFISGGENVYPAEVERVIYEHDAVAECAVIGLPDERWGEIGRALVVLRSGRGASEDELIEHCRHRLARYKVPQSVLIVPELPYGPSGKVLKPQLRALYGAAKPA